MRGWPDWLFGSGLFGCMLCIIAWKLAVCLVESFGDWLCFVVCWLAF